MSLTSWFLVSSGGTRHRLPREMIFVGRDDCELMLQSRSVDKQHAVINYEPSSDEHKVKDLGSLNGTFVNDVRIQEQMYITLKIDDKLRFGYDTNLFTVVRGELQVPEEALKHEKFTSQLQLSKKPSNGESSKSPKSPKSPKSAAAKSLEGKTAEAAGEGPAKPADTSKGDEKVTGDIAALHRGTPLYGQPSWWGDGDADDENSFKQETKTSSRKQENGVADIKEAKRSSKAQEDAPSCVGPEPSYFEIPTKEAQMAESSIHEVPTKDTEGGGGATATTAASSSAASGHASFTIEFDNASPGKVTIKEHVKFAATEPRPRPRKALPQGGREMTTLQAAIMASESKVADWLAQNDPPLPRRDPPDDEAKSIKSDVPMHLKRLKGSKHEDGTQSDSENGAGLRLGGRLQGGRGRGAEGPAPVSRTAFMIEFFDEDNPRKRRSYSFSQTAPLLGEGPGARATDSKGLPPSLAAAAPTAARLLLKQKSEEPGRGGGGEGRRASPGEEAKKVPRNAEKEHDDDQSDKGTYTIELDNRNPEEEEARRMIDKVFGVEESKDPSRLGRPEHLQDGVKDWQGAGVRDTKAPGCDSSEILPDDTVAMGNPRWVSQWASLAANHTRTDPEGSGAESPACIKEKEGDVSESGISHKSGVSGASSHGERKRRTLPPLPGEEKAADGALGRVRRSEIGEKQDTEPQEKESQFDPKEPAARTGHKGGTGAKPTPALEQRPSPKPPARPEEGRRKRPEERGKAAEGEEKSGKPLVRQGSFTIEKPSTNVPLELIPRIGKGTPRERRDSAGSLDTATLLKDTEAVMAFLEARLRDDAGRAPGPAPRSVSPESDVDTASTLSQAAGDGERRAGQKRRTLSSLHKEKSVATPTATTRTAAAPGTRERLERKAKPRPPAATEPRPDPHRRSAQTASRARRPSLDLTDDDQTSSLPHSTISDVLSSDQEAYSSHAHGRGMLTSTDELLHSKLQDSGGAGRTPQAPGSAAGKPATLPRPRPTRASLLRRARLGETSDTDLADADRASVASEVSTTSSTSKPPSGRKALSRIDLLAQPRRNRLGSLSARSDSEATVTRGSASSRLSADTALRLGLRSAGPAPDGKVTPRTRANSVSKLPDAKGKNASSAHSTPAATSRWRRLPQEYASTSEDEFGSNRNSPKHGRLRSGTVLRTARLGGSAPATPGGPAGAVLKHHRMREQEEYIRDWTAHSEEIARISQDLAKDLAILAREIHDVAGEIDSVSSSGTAPSTTVSTAATTPGSTIDTREELVDRVFDESLNFRKIPPIVQTKAPEINGRPVELRPRAPDSLDPQTALRRRTWNRDEAVLDSLLLTSVSQLSSKIRQSVDKTAGKIRILFKDKDRNWDDIESKLRSESDVPLLKTSNKEISSILLELKRVEKQLQVINIMVDPDGTLDALTSLGLTSPVLPKPRTSPGSQGPQGPLPGNGAAHIPSAPPPAEESK
ncbi:centrosomal protein of 170 kDa-like isoform X2 [Megalops cyprinoides]|uniref:centrosomal protein of 170 kDa-like isoform X2 n=1 Tax=Megalops cyprinoides TaxID=118141 RepID=UPI001863E115|nr:centrosomal protein of 170 kDa-like isoform X2 [Megalops cyprinoides]